MQGLPTRQAQNTERVSLTLCSAHECSMVMHASAEANPPAIVRLCRQITSHPYFDPFIIGAIIAAGLLVGLETSKSLMAKYGDLLHLLDDLVLAIFTLEALIKIIAKWPKPLQYFRNGWNCFDFTIVVACLLPAGGAWVSVVRLFRILRVVRLVTQIPKLQRLVNALLYSLPSMGYVMALMGLHFYVYGVMGVFFFRENDPGHFGDLGKSLLTLFRVVTLEDWTDVMYAAIYGTDVYPAQGALPVGPQPEGFGIWAVMFFVSFVLIGAMVMINLFVGVMVNSLAEVHEAELALELKSKDPEAILADIEANLVDLRRTLAARTQPPDDDATT